MATIEERVAYLEGKVDEHSRAWEDLKDMIIHLDTRITALDEKLDRQLSALEQRFSNRIDGLERRIDSLDGRINSLDGRINSLDGRINSLDGRINSLDQKFSRYFLWIIGIQITIFLTIIASFLRP